MAVGNRVAIFVEGVDWHARRLKQAFAARGWRAVFVQFGKCAFEIGGPMGLRLPGFARRLPAAAFVRFIPGGSFEQVTLRLGLLHALRESGVFVCNDARAIERCVDKSMTSFLLQQAGLATPESWVCQTRAAAEEVAAREAAPGRPLVLKPLFGSQGKGLALIEQACELPPPDEVDGVYYLQRYIGAPWHRIGSGDGEGGWRDVRVLVAGGRPVAAMQRHGKSWITNAKQGARCESLRLAGAGKVADAEASELAALATAAADAVGAGVCGVDIMRGPDGRAQVLEVNSMPAWNALQRVSDIDVTQEIVDGFLALLARYWGGAGREAGVREVVG